MDCGICCEKLDKKTRKKISCPYCEYVCCLSCFKHYLLDTSEDAHCMNCRKTLSLDFIAQVTPKIFHNQEYRKKRTDIAVELEKSLLPHTQTLVEDEIKKRKDIETIKNLEKEKRMIMIRLREIKEEIWNLRNPNAQGAEERKEEEEKVKFVKKCQNNDCRGFLSSAWKCVICEAYTCSQCFAIKTKRHDDEHVCKEEDVATAKLILEETKPCPKCGVPISKIDGCDQMWCVSCHTTFSWNKGAIEKGFVHNPHYFEWQRRNGGEAPRVPGDIPMCLEANGLPTFQNILVKARFLKIYTNNFENRYRIVNHIQQISINEFPIRDIDDNSDLRVKYLLNEMDEEKWKYNIQLRDKRREKNICIRQVLEMFTNSMIDYWNQFITSSNMKIVNTTNELRVYVNEQFESIKKRYDNKVPFIDENWIIITKKIRE